MHIYMKKAEIAGAVDKVCDVVPAILKAECQGFIDTYDKAVIIYLHEGIDPTRVCTVMGLCTSQLPHGKNTIWQTSRKECVLENYLLHPKHVMGT